PAMVASQVYARGGGSADCEQRLIADDALPIGGKRALDRLDADHAHRPNRRLVVVAAEQESEEKPRPEGDRDGRSRIVANVLAGVGPEIPVVLLQALRGGLRVLDDVVAQVVV